MPKLYSKYFDGLEYETECLFHFKSGIPGFESERYFAGVEIPVQRPLLYLQSMAREELCLITLPVISCFPEYRIVMASEDMDLIELPPERTPRIGEGIACLGIVTMVEGGEPVMNLGAPLVINLSNRLAVQAIQPEGLYPCQFALTRQHAESSVCS